MKRIALMMLVAAAAAGCGSNSDPAQRLALAALATPTPAATTPTASRPAPSCNLKASLRPPAAMPAPGAMPSGSYMQTIQRRGYLVAGVNASFLNFAYLNPFKNQIEGFEIDLVHQLADAIFGHRANDVKLEALTASQRIPFVRNGNVDIVVNAVTITCSRKQQVDFSTVYYDAAQRVLVPRTSPAHQLADLAGQRVCATEGTQPIEVMSQYPVIPVGAPQAIDCLVLLQQGKVDAISTDDSILAGFAKQDPYTKVVGPPLADVPYGMAISQSHPEFVRFVNGVLARLRADGTWERLAVHWLGHAAPPTPPVAQYAG